MGRFIPRLLLISLFVNGIALGQTLQKIVLQPTAIDSTHYYIAVAPPSKPIKGVLVLLPGFGQSAESIFPETKLHNVAYANQILTIALAAGNKIHCDASVEKWLNTVLDDVKNRFRVGSDHFVIGGYSAGGTIAIRYTELCQQKPANFPITPKATFAVDSPLDLVELWHYFDQEIKKDYSPAGVSEAKFIQSIMRKEIGEPSTSTKNYERLSPFLRSNTKLGNEQFLVRTPLRFYEDSDVAWQLKERRRSFFDMNGPVASELLKRLLLAGNTKVEFMMAKQAGYRSNGMRHPHSWSIVDEVELVQWMQQILQH